MPRPLMQHGVGQLEEVFAKGKADPKVLKQLEHELQHRQVPRAVALLAKVRTAMVGASAAPKSPAEPAAPAQASAPISQQPDLWSHPATQPTVSAPAPACTDAPAVRPPEPLPVVKASASAPAMPLEDAYKALRATPGATWDSIEQTRRALVQHSHPSQWTSLNSEKRAQVMDEAKRVNAAYAVLSLVRCGTH